MTTYTTFAPAPRSAFTFQPTLDGATCSAVVAWNVFGQRWYVSVYDLAGTRIFTLPLLASPDPLQAASAAWDGLRQRAIVATTTPHGLPIGTVAQLTFAGFAPAALNGVALCTVLDPQTVAFPLAADPGAATVLGTVGADLNIAAGYFATSTLVYRDSSSRFEVMP